jgi:hypothetical protein
VSLSIRHMRFALQEREQQQARRDAAWYASLPAEEKSASVHYWWIERRAKRVKRGGRQWIFVSEHFGTKESAANYWREHYQHKNKPVQFRLRHIHKYS